MPQQCQGFMFQQYIGGSNKGVYIVYIEYFLLIFSPEAGIKRLTEISIKLASLLCLKKAAKKTVQNFQVSFQDYFPYNNFKTATFIQTDTPVVKT
ncbi:unnamed protein product, partial [Allacma fusca]